VTYRDIGALKVRVHMLEDENRKLKERVAGSSLVTRFTRWKEERRKKKAETAKRMKDSLAAAVKPVMDAQAAKPITTKPWPPAKEPEVPKKVLTPEGRAARRADAFKILFPTCIIIALLGMVILIIIHAWQQDMRRMRVEQARQAEPDKTIEVRQFVGRILPGLGGFTYTCRDGDHVRRCIVSRTDPAAPLVFEVVCRVDDGCWLQEP
jgi:hypothetical protein